MRVILNASKQGVIAEFFYLAKAKKKRERKDLPIGSTAKNNVTRRTEQEQTPLNSLFKENTISFGSLTRFLPPNKTLF